MTVMPGEFPRVGSVQYPQTTLPLHEREVVLTFDDGPLPPYSTSILDALAAECVKATYFLVGRQANANPDMVRKIYNAGHTIGTHTQNHPLTFDVMSEERAEREIHDGIASVSAALGDARAVAPYFRIPGLLRSKPVEDMLAARGLVVWSVDADADDWTNISADEIVKRAMTRLAKKGKGILLLHDVHPATTLALPKLLGELKRNGYRIVHVAPAGVRPRLHETPIAQAPARHAWPRIASTGTPAISLEAAPSPFRPDTVQAKRPRKLARVEAHPRRPKVTRSWR